MRKAALLAPAFIALSLFAAAAATPALADIQGADTFRVVGLGRYQTLKLMNGPAEWAGVQLEIPSNACNLRATGVREGRWLQVSYRASNGYDFTGWVDMAFLAPDRFAPPADGNYGYAPPPPPPQVVYVPVPQETYVPAYQPPPPPPRHIEARWPWQVRHDRDHRWGNYGN